MSNKLSSEDRQATEEETLLAVPVHKASKMSGFGQTIIWQWLKEGRVEAVRVPGVRRTLVSYGSLRRLLENASTGQPPRRGPGRPRKHPLPTEQPTV
jgi:hypothetical protein